MPTKSKLMIAVSVILLAAVLVIVNAITKAQQPYTQVIMNLLNGQQYFGAPHIYSGYHYSPTSQWPVYYGPSTASQYWSQGGISSNQPVLELTPAKSWSGGAVFWSEIYSGGPVKITIIGTYTKGTPPVTTGFVIYLFLTPTMWCISPIYNYSTLFKGVNPQSSTPYIVVWWDPGWQPTGHTQSGVTGQWNVGVITNPFGNHASASPSPSPTLGPPSSGWMGIGTGAFEPEPGDWINVTVTYDPSTNTLGGVAYDMNHTGWETSFTLNLTGYYTPPGNGTYVFGVGTSISNVHYVNWALLYVAMMGNVKPTFCLVPTWVVAIAVRNHLEYCPSTAALL